MEVVIILFLLIILGLVTSLYISKPNNKIRNYLDNIPITTDDECLKIDECEYDNNTLLDTNTFIEFSNYNDKKQDSRTDAILKCLGHIEFWITLIGIYFLLKFIIAIFKIIVVIEGSKEILELLNQIL